MLYRNNNSLEIPLSAIAFGGASLSGEGAGYGFGAMSETEAETLLKASWEHGINLYDTAPIYGFGLSEERMGRYLPKEAVVVTKGGVDWHANRRVNMSNGPQVIEKMLHESLKRLKREMVDVYMIHWPDARVDIRRPLEVLKKAQQEGKIKKIGLCNTNLQDLEKASEIVSVDFLQSELNLFRSEAFDLLEGAWKEKFSMSWGTLDKGILSGRVFKDRKFTSEDCRSWAPWWDKKQVAGKIEKVDKLKMILKKDEISLLEFSLSYNLNYGISSCLIGFKAVEDLFQTVQCLKKIVSSQKIGDILVRW